MRVLITTSPGIGHIFPTVSTAWALRAAGHDVMLATGGNTELAAHAGLQVVDSAPGVDFGQVFGNFVAEHRPRTNPPDMAFVAAMFATVSRQSVEGTIELVRDWRPDLVVYTPLQAVGPLAAAIAGVPSVAHTIGIGQSSTLWDVLTEQFAPEYERYGVTPTDPAAVLDVSPPSLREPGSDGWSMRYVPYNGGAILPDWVVRPRERARVTVTLGSVLPVMAGIGGLKPLVAGIGDMPAEFVITLGGADAADFGSLPDTCDWWTGCRWAHCWRAVTPSSTTAARAPR